MFLNNYNYFTKYNSTIAEEREKERVLNAT